MPGFRAKETHEKTVKLPAANLTCDDLLKVVALMRGNGAATHHGSSRIAWSQGSSSSKSNFSCTEPEPVLESKDVPKNPTTFSITVDGKQGRAHLFLFETHGSLDVERPDIDDVDHVIDSIKSIFKENRKTFWWLKSLPVMAGVGIASASTMLFGYIMLLTNSEEKLWPAIMIVAGLVLIGSAIGFNHPWFNNTRLHIRDGKR